MKEYTRCNMCGRKVGVMQAHNKKVCEEQVETNRLNLGYACQWCGVEGVRAHKEGCPLIK